LLDLNIGTRLNSIFSVLKISCISQVANINIYQIASARAAERAAIDLHAGAGAAGTWKMQLGLGGGGAAARLRRRRQPHHPPHKTRGQQKSLACDAQCTLLPLGTLCAPFRCSPRVCFSSFVCECGHCGARGRRGGGSSTPASAPQYLSGSAVWFQLAGSFQNSLINLESIQALVKLYC